MATSTTRIPLQPTEDRMKHHEYKNWLKLTELTLITVDTLTQNYVEVKLNEFHNDLKKEIAEVQPCRKCKPKIRPSEDCPTCYRWVEILEKHHVQTRKTKDHKEDQAAQAVQNLKLDQADHADKGDDQKEDQVGKVQTSQVKGPCWENVDPKRFYIDKYEVAKLYMNSGQIAGKLLSACDLDASALFNLLINCDTFHTTTSTKCSRKILNLKNQHISHTSTMNHVPDKDVKAFVQAANTIIDKGQQFCAVENMVQANNMEQAKEEIKRISKLEFRVELGPPAPANAEESASALAQANVILQKVLSQFAETALAEIKPALIEYFQFCQPPPTTSKERERNVPENEDKKLRLPQQLGNRMNSYCSQNDEAKLEAERPVLGQHLSDFELKCRYWTDSTVLLKWVIPDKSEMSEYPYSLMIYQEEQGESNEVRLTKTYYTKNEVELPGAYGEHVELRSGREYTFNLRVNFEAKDGDVVLQASATKMMPDSRCTDTIGDFLNNQDVLNSLCETMDQKPRVWRSVGSNFGLTSNKMDNIRLYATPERPVTAAILKQCVEICSDTMKMRICYLLQILHKSCFQPGIKIVKSWHMERGPCNVCKEQFVNADV